MNRIIINIKPFSLQQEISVYKEDKCINNSKSTLEEMNDNITMLKHKYNVEEIHFYGSKDFISKYATDLKTNFNNDNIIIKIN